MFVTRVDQVLETGDAVQRAIVYRVDIILDNGRRMSSRVTELEQHS